jgi:hypothetical protein
VVVKRSSHIAEISCEGGMKLGERKNKGRLGTIVVLAYIVPHDRRIALFASKLDVKAFEAGNLPDGSETTSSCRNSGAQRPFPLGLAFIRRSARPSPLLLTFLALEPSVRD